MSLRSRWVVWTGWLFACAGIVLAGSGAVSFMSDTRHVLVETYALGVDERLSDLRPEQMIWLASQQGGRWGRYGWYLAAGERGSLQLALPGVQPGILKLRLWAFSPGHLSFSVRDGTSSHEIPSGDLDGRVVQLFVHGPTELAIVATSDLSQEQLVLDRFAVAWFPFKSQLPPLWPAIGFITFGLCGCTLLVYQHRSLSQGRRIWLGCAGILTATVVGFAFRWALFDIARGLPADPDAAAYMSYARSLDWFTWDHGFYSGSFNEREPVHVAALNLWFRLWGDIAPAMMFYTVCLSTVLVMACGVFIWGFTGQWLFGILASWVVAVSPVWIDESVRGLRLESLSLLFLAVLGVWVWMRGWLGALLLGVLTGSMALVQSPALWVTVPLIWLGWLLNLWRERHGLVLLRPCQWRWTHLSLASLIAALLFVPHLYGLYKVHGDPSWPSDKYARWNANVEFQDRLGTVGFPAAEEFEENRYAGPRITYREYLFRLHSVSQLIYGQLKGWAESTVYMSISHTPKLNGLVFLHHASGFPAVLRHLNAVTLVILVLSLGLTAVGWIDLWWKPQYWWVPFLSLWGTWYVAYLYSVRLVEPFRHTGHVYPLLLLGLLWGGFQTCQWLQAVLFSKTEVERSDAVEAENPHPK